MSYVKEFHLGDVLQRQTNAVQQGVSEMCKMHVIALCCAWVYDLSKRSHHRAQKALFSFLCEPSGPFSTISQ